MNDSTIEVPLRGGNTNANVVRVGETVRRPAAPWSKSVDALLAFFEAQGVEGAPRPRGYDVLGRQMLSYVHGDVDPDPSDLDVARLFQVGQLIRRLHDTAAQFPSPEDAIWNVLISPDHEDLICHHDLAPWNLVRSATAMTFIDWDGAGPGSRLWDLSYAAHGFVPLSARSGLREDATSERLRALVDGYGLDAAERVALIELLAPRTRSMYEYLRRSHDEGRQPWSRLWLEGHGEMWLEDAIYVEGHRDLWAAALR